MENTETDRKEALKPKYSIEEIRETANKIEYLDLTKVLEKDDFNFDHTVERIQKQRQKEKEKEEKKAQERMKQEQIKRERAQ